MAFIRFNTWYSSRNDNKTQQRRETYSLDVEWAIVDLYKKYTERSFEFDSPEAMADKIVDIKLEDASGPYESLRITNGFTRHHRGEMPWDEHTEDFFILRGPIKGHYNISEGRRLNKDEFSRLKNRVVSCLDNIK